CWTMTLVIVGVQRWPIYWHNGQCPFIFSSRPHPASIRINAKHSSEKLSPNIGKINHVESANASSHKNNEPIILDLINKNRPTVDSLSLDSSASNDNFILSSLNAQLRTGLVDLCLNTTRQYLNLIQKEHTKMGVSSLLAKSLGKGPWHARCIRAWANQ
ncbi:25131_t:CDS:2, partial [Dentiscutata erythropus]